MKTWIMTGLITMLIGGAVCAQEFIPPDPAARDPGPGPGGEIAALVEKWLDHVQETDPTEYDRLMQLRRDDPEAFRDEVRMRLKEHMKKRFGERGRDGFGPPDAPDRPSGEPGARAPRGGRQPGGNFDREGMPGRGRGRFQREQNPEIAALEQKVQELTREYHKAEKNGKDAARAELKNTLTRLFDLREQERIDQLEHMREELKRFQDILDKRQSMRDDIIGRRLEQITNPELSW